MCWCKSNNFCMISIFGKNINLLQGYFSDSKEKIRLWKNKKMGKNQGFRFLPKIRNKQAAMVLEWVLPLKFFTTGLPITSISDCRCIDLHCLVQNSNLVMPKPSSLHLISLPCAWFVEMKDMTWKSMVYWELVLFLA